MHRRCHAEGAFSTEAESWLCHGREHGGPTVSKIKAEADKAGREADISTCVCMDAFFAMKAMDMKKHDMILREKAGELKGYDCIVLAQASMAHLEDETASITGCPVLTSPSWCMEEIKKNWNGRYRDDE